MFPLYDTNPHRRIPWLTVLIILANVAVMFWLAQRKPLEQQQIVIHRGFIPQRIQQLNDPKLVVEVPVQQPEGQPLPGVPANAAKPQPIQVEADQQEIYASLFTMMFLHGSWWHLISNMWFLWIFGNNIEDRLGHFFYACFYLLGGLVALACHWADDPNSTLPVIGASGAVAAVLGAYAITFPMAKVRTLFFIVIIFVIDVPALIILGLWFLQQVLAATGQLGQGMQLGVAWWAHIGGFVAGLVLMPLMAVGAPPPGTDWEDDARRQFESDVV